MAVIADEKASLTIGEQLRHAGVSRRDFIKFCTELMIVAPVGLALTQKSWAGEVADEIAAMRPPSVVWLHFQDCAGCTETLLRTSLPGVDELIFSIISLDYHETLMPSSGKQAEEALRSAVEGNTEKFFLVVEGSVPTKEQGIYMKLAGKPATEMLEGARLPGEGRVRHWLLRVVGRDSLSRRQSHGRGRRLRSAARRAHRQSARLSADSLQPHRHGARVYSDWQSS